MRLGVTACSQLGAENGREREDVILALPPKISARTRNIIPR